MKKFLRFVLYFIAFILLLGLGTLKVVDRTPPREQDYYTQMMSRLDSLSESFQITPAQPFEIGYSKISLTPDSIMALAGYGARDPMEFDEIRDSVYVRVLIIKTQSIKAAILSADLLIIHPLMTKALHTRAQGAGWNPQNIFLTATHTHSSIGQWAPGLVGGLFAGEYEPKVAELIAERMIEGLKKAESKLVPASIGYSQVENPDLVLNRLVGNEGIEDPFQKNLVFQTGKRTASFTAFSAHATCLTSQSRKLSADFPGAFHQKLSEDTTSLFSIYAAGAVASMGPETEGMDQFERTEFLGGEIAQRINEPNSFVDSIRIGAFRIPLELGTPQFKISKDLALRPYLFKRAFGDEKSEISGLLLGNVLLLGMPCDFSGELAIPLYEFAKQRGLELIITSFNGGYIGYITKDEWYDLEKYETRTMNWYGPGNGAYFSEIIEKLIVAVDENYKANTPGR